MISITNFCDDKCDDHTVVNIEFWLSSFCSVQTSYIVWLCVKNWIEKWQIFFMLWCTNIVWQKCRTSFASFSSPKHHFLKFLPRLLHCHNKEGTISIVWNIWKSVVFSTVRWHLDKQQSKRNGAARHQKQFMKIIDFAVNSLAT